MHVMVSPVPSYSHSARLIYSSPHLPSPPDTGSPSAATDVTSHRPHVARLLPPDAFHSPSSRTHLPRLVPSSSADANRRHARPSTLPRAPQHHDPVATYARPQYRARDRVSGRRPPISPRPGPLSGASVRPRPLHPWRRVASETICRGGRRGDEPSTPGAGERAISLGRRCGRLVVP